MENSLNLKILSLLIKNDIKIEVQTCKKKLNTDSSGTAGVKSDLITSEISSFGNNFLPSLINKKNKKKICYISLFF